MVKLENDEPATPQLTFDGSTITWFRGGSAPELAWAEFEASNNGLEWSNVGTGIRIPGGWQLTGLNLPDDARVRARGQVSVALKRLVHVSSYPIETSVSAPFIFAQPAVQTQTINSRTTFSAGVEGTSPLHYQWFFNSEPIAGETNAFLQLPRLEPSDEGLYSLMASNTLGVVPSGVARLTTTHVLLVPSPRIRGVAVTDDAIQFTWDTQIGGQYLLEYTADLNRHTWETFGGSQIPSFSAGFSWADNPGIVTALDTSLTLTHKFRGDPRLFYRLIVLPRQID